MSAAETAHRRVLASIPANDENDTKSHSAQAAALLQRVLRDWQGRLADGQARAETATGGSRRSGGSGGGAAAAAAGRYGRFGALASDDDDDGDCDPDPGGDDGSNSVCDHAATSASAIDEMGGDGTAEECIIWVPLLQRQQQQQ